MNRDGIKNAGSFSDLLDLKKQGKSRLSQCEADEWCLAIQHL